MSKRRMKGNGAVYFDEKRGKYVGQITLGVDENGKRKRKTVYGSTKTEVNNKLKKIEYQIFTGDFVDKSTITIYHLAKQLLDDKLNQNEIKEPSYYRNLETLKILKPIYNTELQKANETQLKNFLNNNLHYSQSVINKFYEMLTRTFKEAARRKIISSNPMEFIKKPYSKKKTVRVRALTKGEHKNLLEILHSEDINYSEQILLSLSMGLRMGEVNALCVEDVNFNFNRLTVRRTISKGKKGEAILGETTKTNAGTRTLTMSEEVTKLLKLCIGNKQSGLIFTQNNKLITTSQVNSQFSRMLKKYNILDETITDGKIVLHSLRHTFGTTKRDARLGYLFSYAY